MYGECKVKNCGSKRQSEQVALRSKYKYFLIVDVHIHLFHYFGSVFSRCFKKIANVCHPIIETFLALHTFILEMGSQTLLCNFIHTLRAYLNLHPALAWTGYRSMQRFVSVRFWNGYPILQSRRVWLEHVCHNGKGFPTVASLVFKRGVDNDSYGKQIIDVFEFRILFPHLVPNGIDGLGAPFYLKFEAVILKLLFNRSDKFGNIFVSFLL